MKPIHLIMVAMNARRFDAAEFGTYTTETDPQIWACRQALRPGIAFSILNGDNMPVACFGFSEENPRLATIWLIATDKWTTHVKTIARGIEKVRASGVYRRIQAWIRPDCAENIKFIEWLGFTRDGLCPAIAPNGADMLLYSKLGESNG